MKDPVYCSNCRADLTELNDQPEGCVPCPHCGSTRRILTAHLEGRLTFLSKLTLRKPGVKGRPLTEVLKGFRRGRDGLMVRIYRLIDRTNYRYRERVETEGGKLLVDKDDDLRQHK